jgi:hypothetical protein
MRQTVVQCDRCGANILERRTIVEVKAGERVRQFCEPLDLCSGCSGLFAHFVAVGHQANQAATPAAVPVLLGGLNVSSGQCV